MTRYSVAESTLGPGAGGQLADLKFSILKVSKKLVCVLLKKQHFCVVLRPKPVLLYLVPMFPVAFPPLHT